MIAIAVAFAITWLHASDAPVAYAVRYYVWKYIHAVRDASVVADGVELHYIEAGHGPVLVFLHGGGVDHDVFFAQLPLFARNYHVIAPDTRGHGLSTRGTGALSYTRYALDYPERVCRMVLMHE